MKKEKENKWLPPTKEMHESFLPNTHLGPIIVDPNSGCLYNSEGQLAGGEEEAFRAIHYWEIFAPPTRETHECNLYKSGIIRHMGMPLYINELEGIKAYNSDGLRAGGYDEFIVATDYWGLEIIHETSL